MKNPLRNILTANEQKIVIFLLFFAIFGLSLKFLSSNISAKENGADSLDFSEDYLIIYDLRNITIKEIQTLPGIGPKRAATIIAYRKDYGFDSLQDLMNVKGIGKTSYQKLEKHFIDFGKTEPTTNNQVKTNSDLSLININTANTEELILLPGIGPSKAQKIITKREELTQFSSLEQLLDIKGIGKNTLEKLRDKITLGAEK